MGAISAMKTDRWSSEEWDLQKLIGLHGTKSKLFPSFFISQFRLLIEMLINGNSLLLTSKQWPWLSRWITRKSTISNFRVSGVEQFWCKEQKNGFCKWNLHYKLESFVGEPIGKCQNCSHREKWGWICGQINSNSQLKFVGPSRLQCCEQSQSFFGTSRPTKTESLRLKHWWKISSL